MDSSVKVGPSFVMELVLGVVGVGGSACAAQSAGFPFGLVVIVVVAVPKRASKYSRAHVHLCLFVSGGFFFFLRLGSFHLS